jgi:hypothetical protein
MQRGLYVSDHLNPASNYRNNPATIICVSRQNIERRIHWLGYFDNPWPVSFRSVTYARFGNSEP